MKKALINYYSNSNNTRKVAKVFQTILKERGWTVITRNLISKSETGSVSNWDLVITGVPVHYWDIPRAALEAIRNLPAFNQTYGFVFSTFGKCVCNSVPYNLAKELQKKDVTVIGGAQIVMPNSTPIEDGTVIGDIEASYGKGEVSQTNLNKIKKALISVISRIEGGTIKEFDIRKLKRLHTRNMLGLVASSLMTTKKRIDSMPPVLYRAEFCQDCKRCIKNCDYQIIHFSGEKSVLIDNEQCMRCYACINACKSNALYSDWRKIRSSTDIVHKLSKNTETKILTIT
jgi:ferredoxin/flavodoxin